MDNEKPQDSTEDKPEDIIAAENNATPDSEELELPTPEPGSLYVEPSWTHTPEGRSSHESKRKAIIFTILVPTLLVLTAVLRQMTDSGYVVLTPVALALVAGIIAGCFWHRGNKLEVSHREKMSTLEGENK